MNTSMTKSMLLHMGGVPVGGGIPFPFKDGHVWFVDGTNGSDSQDGRSLNSAKATVQDALDECDVGDVVLVWPKEMAVTDSDPGSYEENITISTPQVSIVGVGRGRTQGGLPQLKVGDTTTDPIISIEAPGVQIWGMGINGSGGTGGGILLNGDNGSTCHVLGTTIEGCHFKNCVGTTATNAATGGAIQWPSGGGGWQTLIRGNRFYKNVGDIVMKGTGYGVVQDVVIEDNIFGGPLASVDCNIYVAADGITGLIIRNNTFSAIPTIGSGTNADFLVLTGCVGILCGNMFACEDGRTFGAAGDELVPTTVFMAGNFSEKAAAQVANGGDVYRT